MKPLAHHMEETGTNLEQLVKASGLEAKLVRAIAAGNYTPSPSERQRLAAALGVAVEDIAWGHAVPVEHMWGHGPQFGRTP
jgi:ribosome-binding protein aMBF1 (putative translation factor)